MSSFVLQGHRVRLDLSKLQSFRVFPGQVVAVEGVNPNGDRLIAMRMIHSQATARPQQLESRLEAPESGDESHRADMNRT